MSASTDAIQSAFRARALTLSVATTGPITMSVTVNGYVRTSGSFVDDGFRAGMEVTPAGFTHAINNEPRVIQEVSALALKCDGTFVAPALGSTSLTVGLPSQRVWELTELLDEDGNPTPPVAGKPYIADRLVPATAELRTFPANGGQVEETGLYVLQWFGMSGVGATAIRRSMDALKALFAPGLGMGTLADGSVLRVQALPGPVAGQITKLEKGWSVCTLNVPWLARSVNAV